MTVISAVFPFLFCVNLDTLCSADLHDIPTLTDSFGSASNPDPQLSHTMTTIENLYGCPALASFMISTNIAEAESIT